MWDLYRWDAIAIPTKSQHESKGEGKGGVRVHRSGNEKGAEGVEGERMTVSLE